MNHIITSHNVPNLNITRSDVLVTLSKSLFGKQSPRAGKEFYYPAVTEENLQDIIKWLGVSDAVNILDRYLRKVFMDIFTDAWDNNVDENGKLNETAFIAQLNAEYPEFSAGTVLLSDLNDKIDELQDQQQELWGKAPTDPADENFVPVMQQLKAISLKITPLKEKAAALSAKYEARAANRKPRAKKTETAASE